MTNEERQELREEFHMTKGVRPHPNLICDSCVTTFVDEYVEWLEEYVQDLADRINASNHWEDL